MAARVSVLIALIILCLSGCNDLRGANDGTKPRAIEVFVSLGGNDADAGTSEKPVATLERARDLVRELRRNDPAACATITLRGGVYVRSRSWKLGRRDSGADGRPFTIAAARGERVVLTGACQLDRDWFKPVSEPHVLNRVIDIAARQRLLVVDLRDHGIEGVGEIQRRGFSRNNLGGTPPSWLYVSDKRMTLARWPNPDDHMPDWLPKFVQNRRGVVSRSAIVEPGPKFQEPGYLERGPVYRFAFDRPRLWSAAKDIYLDGIFNNSWEWSYNRVASIDVVNKTIAMRYGECTGVADKFSGHFFFAENLIEEIDTPGEYWIDRERGLLYFLPPAAFETSRDSASLTMLGEPMIEATDASHVVLRDIELALGRGLAVKVSGGAGVAIEACTVRDFAEGGVVLSGKQHRIASSRLVGVGGTAVTLSGGDPLTLDPGGSVVEDCEILDTGWYHRVYHPAIAMRGVAQRASHNRILRLPHQAIALNGNDHVIEFNEIGSACNEFSDMGAVYMVTGENPLQRGTVVRDNYIHDIGTHPLQNGVYPDNGTMGVTIERNVFVRIGGRDAEGSNCRAIDNNSGAHVIARDNIFMDCPIPYLISAHSGGANHDEQLGQWKTLFEKHPLATLPHIKRYPELAKFWDEERRYPTTNVFERNVVWNPNRPLVKTWHQGKNMKGAPIVDGAVREYDGLAVRNNWVAPGNPGFTDAAKGDFSLRSDAECFKRIPGFVPVRWNEIGPRGRPGPALVNDPAATGR